VYFLKVALKIIKNIEQILLVTFEKLRKYVFLFPILHLGISL